MEVNVASVAGNKPYRTPRLRGEKRRICVYLFIFSGDLHPRRRRSARFSFTYAETSEGLLLQIYVCTMRGHGSSWKTARKPFRQRKTADHGRPWRVKIPHILRNSEKTFLDLSDEDFREAALQLSSSVHSRSRLVSSRRGRTSKATLPIFQPCRELPVRAYFTPRSSRSVSFRLVRVENRSSSLKIQMLMLHGMRITSVVRHRGFGDYGDDDDDDDDDDDHHSTRRTKQ